MYGGSASGGSLDAETGLNYNFFRDYDPSTGRYVESDLLGLYGGQISTYNYVNANPFSYIDPKGLDVTVTLYQGNAGHIGIGVNSTSTMGYYPAENKTITPLNISVPGVEMSDSQEIPVGSITIQTTAAQDAAVQSYLDSKVKNPGKYNLYSNNCTITVEHALQAGGVSTPNVILPASLFLYLQQTYTPTVPAELWLPPGP